MVSMLVTQVAALACVHGSHVHMPPPAKERPHDPWVFRSVLDGNARVITCALSDELWVAYDAQTCGLIQAWKGGVKFDGAVYTTVHGPQPTSEGGVYTTAAGVGDTWTMFTEGAPRAIEARYRGYKLTEGGVELRYDLAGLDGSTIGTVREYPEIKASRDGSVLLERRFTLLDLAEGVDISLVVNGEYLREGRGDLSVNGKWLAAEGGLDRIESLEEAGTPIDWTRIPIPLVGGETVLVQSFAEESDE